MIDKFMGEFRFLSNFYRMNLKFEGKVYPTTEHAFQAAKTLDKSQKIKIRNANSPGDAKRLGRQVKLRPYWEEIKKQEMLMITRVKFCNSVLMKKLTDTGTQVLTEGNTWHDNYWGNCVCQECSSILGENHLGLILMQVREELQD